VSFGQLPARSAVDGERFRKVFQLNRFETGKIDLHHLFFIPGTALSPACVLTCGKSGV